ncbi:MAG TPA: kelch repeat-containing protein, partial [Bryobacteraceae bacterium]|nr:kelch repeat-containing protein [Bryobacteraceae bacterium]
MRAALVLLAVQLAGAQTTGIWESRALYPLEATEVSGAAIDGRVYVVCGLTRQGSTNRLFRYDPRVDSWTELAPLPIAGGADHCNVAAAGGKLYVLGAIRIGSSFIDGATWEYDPAQDRWRSVGRMNTPRGASGVAVIGVNIYVAGGLAARGSVADFEVFDTGSQRWTRLPDMPTARDHLTAQAVNGRFYAIAGRAGREFTANEEYDPAITGWRARAAIPTARGGLGSAVVDNRILVFGGEGSSGTPEGTFRQNEEYDPATDTWRALAPMPTPRHGLYGI